MGKWSHSSSHGFELFVVLLPVAESWLLSDLLS